MQIDLTLEIDENGQVRKDKPYLNVIRRDETQEGYFITFQHKYVREIYYDVYHYTGEMQYNKRNGMGKFVSHNGRVQEGEWKDNTLLKKE